MQSIIPLTPAVFHILLALVDRERHGYGIMQEVSERTEGKVVLGPGTLYGTISRMLQAGYIEESGERSDSQLNDERRRYYRITAKGRRAAATEARSLQEANAARAAAAAARGISRVESHLVISP